MQAGHGAANGQQQQQLPPQQLPLQRPGLATSKLLLLAGGVRVAYLLLILGLSHLIRDYDTSASLLSESCDDDWPQRVAAAAAAAQHGAAVPGVVWDAVFLHRIAACGYEYEQFFAFFPGLPGLVHLIRATGALPGPWGFTAIVLLLNTVCFLASVLLLTRLSQHFLEDDRLAATAVILFTVNPASIHHSLLYTEALFTATSWAGLYCLYCRGCSSAASLAFAASAAVRSNGLLNAGFLMHEHGRRVLAAAFDHRWGAVAKQAAAGVLFVTLAVAPYFAYMRFGYDLFCTGVYGGAGRQRPWCTNALPSAYGYVQDAYWNVGFLRYYEWCQIPNFLLAAPTLIVSLWGAAAYARACWHHVLTGGLLPAAQLQRWFSCCSSLSEQAGRWPALVVVGRERYCSGSSTPGGGATAAAAKKIPGVAYQQLRLRQREVSAGQQAAGQPPPPQQQQQSLKPACASSCGCASHRAFYGPGCAVLVVHWAALTLVCLAVVHIQVATRFLSSCAPLYWFGGLLMLAAPPALRCLLWWYCFAFMATGAVMFPNFLPWT